jgi:hypothetical protein
METLSLELSDRVVTLDPNGKKGAVLERTCYDRLKDFIISSFDTCPEVFFEKLVSNVGRCDLNFPYVNTLWCLLKVKQDLEARGVIKIRFVGIAPKRQLLKINRQALKRINEASQ